MSERTLNRNGCMFAVGGVFVLIFALIYAAGHWAGVW